MTTRRNFVKGATASIAAGMAGFPMFDFAIHGSGAFVAQADSGAPDALPASVDDTPVATNGYLSSLLAPGDRLALRRINVRLTQLTIQQCSIDTVANQIAFDTLICEYLGIFIAHGVSTDDLLRLARNFDVVFPWSLAYGNVKTTFNARFIRFPLAVVFPRTVLEVVFWINFVREHEFSVSIRSGNNCYESFSIDNDIVIDLTFLTVGKDGEQFMLDEEAGVVHVAPGVRLGVLYTELAKSGFAFAGGQCSPVCAGGLVLTGGVGFSTREFGYACDQLVEAECVLADGTVLVANASNEYKDLFQALKGAGAAGLATVTRLTLAVVPMVMVLFYTVTFQDLNEAPTVLEAWQNLAASAPDELSSVANITSAIRGAAGPTAFFIDGEFRVESGSVEDAEARLGNILQTQWLGLLPPSLGETPIDIKVLTAVEAATEVALQVPQPVYNQWKLKSNFVFKQLSKESLQPMVNFLLNNAPSNNPATGIGALTILLMAGKANRINPNNAVVPARKGSVTWIHGGALWNDQMLEKQSLEFVDRLFGVLGPILQSRTTQYGVRDLQLGSQLATPPNLNYLQAYWSSPTLNFVSFLIDVKHKYDPDDLFKFAQSIPVTSETPRF
jgi:hypothetical protein